MRQRFSRRHFLKLGGAAALGLTFRPLPPEEGEPPPEPLARLHLGRVTSASVYYDQPSTTAKSLGTYSVDTLLTVYEEKSVDTEAAPHNPIWFRTNEGWVHSSFIQPVRNDLNRPILNVPESGFLAEVTVPFTEAWRNDGAQATLAYRFYYSTTHWVDKAVTDEQGKVWYRIPDDRYEATYFVLAQHLRRVSARELTPLSPDVLDKRIEVDLAQQKLSAYENGSAVFTVRVSTGRAVVPTPVGEFKVERKRPSRHMAASDGGGNGFDLPGVPWVAYIFWTGVAFHGTYWHNDYGRPRSRGCINLTPADAKWIYRWTLPVVPPEEEYVRDANGTDVTVF